MRTVLNVMCPEKQKKPVKARVGSLSSWESGCKVHFPPQDLVVPVNLSHLRRNTVDTAGQCPRQVKNLYTHCAGRNLWSDHTVSLLSVEPPFAVQKRNYASMSEFIFISIVISLPPFYALLPKWSSKMSLICHWLV